MKTTITLIAAVLLLMMAGCTQAGQKGPSGIQSASAQDKVPEGARYGVKSAIIKKTSPFIMVMGAVREITVYIDDYGAKEAVEVNMDAEQMQQHTLAIREAGGKTIVIDLDGKTAGRIQDNEPRDYRHLTPEEIKRFKITEVGTETVAGKPCKVFRMDLSEGGEEGYDLIATRYVWEGIVLAQELSSEMMHGLNSAEEVQSIEINVPIPPEKFEIPKGIKIKESSNE